MSCIVTHETILNALSDPRPGFKERFIGKALVAIFNNQTEDEQNVNDTKIHNEIGFSASDAYSGSLTAKYFLRHRTLLPWQVEKWLKPISRKTSLPRIAKYHKQLDTIARKKRNIKSGREMKPITSQAEMDMIEREMNTMVRLAEDELERKAFEYKYARDGDL